MKVIQIPIGYGCYIDSTTNPINKIALKTKGLGSCIGVAVSTEKGRFLFHVDFPITSYGVTEERFLNSLGDYIVNNISDFKKTEEIKLDVLSAVFEPLAAGEPPIDTGKNLFQSLKKKIFDNLNEGQFLNAKIHQQTPSKENGRYNLVMIDRNVYISEGKKEYRSYSLENAFSSSERLNSQFRKLAEKKYLNLSMFRQYGVRDETNQYTKNGIFILKPKEVDIFTTEKTGRINLNNLKEVLNKEEYERKLIFKAKQSSVVRQATFNLKTASKPAR